MKTICQSILACATMLFTITSCSNTPNEQILILASTSLKGDLSDYYEVIDKEYKVLSGFSQYVSVELKRNDTPFAFNANDVEPFGVSSGKNGNAGFGIEVFDEQGNQLYVCHANSGKMQDETAALISLKPGESGFLNVTLYLYEDEIKNAKTFKMSSALEMNYDNDKVTTTNQSSTSSNNWDSVINDYEDFVDKYLMLLKKVKAGDTSAMTEYVQYMEKATSLAKKIEKARSEMTTDQMGRFAKLQNKLISAASSL